VVLVPFIGVGFRYQGYDVVTALNLAGARYRVPESIRVDNGLEFISKEVDLWAYAHGVVLDLSRPGTPRTVPSSKPLTAAFGRSI
jgi:putative transposase